MGLECRNAARENRGSGVGLLIIACMADSRNWGGRVAASAKAKGHETVLFRTADQVERADYAFCRIAQDAPRLHQDRVEVEALHKRGINIVPDMRMIRQYEDKWAQAEAYRQWFPRTELISSRDEAEAIAEDMEYPFLSKSRHGSASKNVRLIESRHQALAETELAFGSGIPAWGHRQTGYLIWQELCRGNEYDYRVTAIGREIAIGRRWNKPGTFFASGHSEIENLDESDPEAAQVLAFARSFLSTEDMTFAAIDVVKGSQGWRVIETSLAWPADRKPWTDRKFVSGRSCRDLFDVIVEEIEAGELH